MPSAKDRFYFKARAFHRWETKDFNLSLEAEREVEHRAELMRLKYLALRVLAHQG